MCVWMCVNVFTCCEKMFSSNSCLVAVFRTWITDSVFSRRGRKKSKARPGEGVARPTVCWACCCCSSCCCCSCCWSVFLGESSSWSRVLTKSVRIGSPFDLFRWKMALDRCGCAWMAAAVGRSPKTAECRLDIRKMSEFSRRKPRTKFIDSFESLSCRLWPLSGVLQLLLLLLLLLLDRKLFRKAWLALTLFAKISLFTRFSSFSLLKSSSLWSALLFGLFEPADVDGVLLPPSLAGKNRSKSQSRSSTASSLSWPFPMDDDDDVVDSGDWLSTLCVCFCIVYTHDIKVVVVLCMFYIVNGGGQK